MTTITTYMPIGDIPQSVLDSCKDEFGMEILYLPELRTKRGNVYAPQRDVLVIFGGERYCVDCNEYVDAVQEIGITWVGDDLEECEWDEIGEKFCPECHSDNLPSSAEEYIEDMRQSYDEDRGMDSWRGLD